MRAHFPPLGVAHTQQRSVRAARRPRRGANPRNLQVACSGPGRGAGRGGVATAGHGWDSAHLQATRTQEAAEFRADRPHVRRAGEAGSSRPSSRGRRQAQTPGSGWGGRLRTGESAARAGDGRAWAAGAPSQRCARGSDTHARPRTKRTGGQTHRHTRQWTQPDRHRETRGSVWAALVACLSLEDWSETVECSTRGCKVGVGGGRLGVCRGRRPGARSCPMLPGETLARL